MSFKVEPEIINIEEIQGLSSDLANLNSNAENLSDQTDNLGGSIPELSKGLSVNLKVNRIVVVGYGGSGYSRDGINWTINSIPEYFWNSVAYGNGKFVAITEGGPSVYSQDGITWTMTTMPTNNIWRSVTYGNGKFVAITFNENKAAYSTDGINWTLVTLPLTRYWFKIAYGNGKFVAVALASSAALYSTDGIDWTESTMPQQKDWRSVAYGNGKFVAIGPGSIVAYSYDGINWSSDSILTRTWMAVAFGNGTFVLISSQNTAVLYSYEYEGSTYWAPALIPISEYWDNLFYCKDKFIAVTQNSNIAAYSTSGETWTQIAFPELAWPSLASGKVTITRTVAEILGVN